MLYVQDVHSARGAAIWKGVFIADMSTATPRITLAQQGILVSQGPDTLHLHLTDGSTHEADPRDPDRYQISTFEQTDIPISLPQAANKQEEEPAPLAQTSTWDLPREARRTNSASARWYNIEFHRRFALPTACLVLALVGIPLGLSSQKGGKSTGFVLTIILVLVYYSVSLLGVSFARQGKISAGLGAWLADIVFFFGGAFLLWRAERRPFEIAWLKWNPFKDPLKERQRLLFRARTQDVVTRAQGRRRVFSASFPTLLDDYVLHDFLQYLALVLGAFMMLFLVFTVFDLLGDILRNQISPLVVGAYLLNVAPFYLYLILPLGVLMAVLITLGLMQRSNEITAIKATGVSIYRVIVPVLVAAVLLAVGLFSFDQLYLPYTNKRQDALRSQIKGKPPQTYLNPSRKWIFGQHSNIYYYQFFDSDRDQFGNLSVFQFEPATFHLTRRIYASSAHWEDRLQRWVCTQGWEREFRRPGHAELPPLRRCGSGRHQRATGLLQEGSQAVFGDELSGVEPLHPRPAAERFRRGAVESSAAEKAGLSGDRAGHGGARDPLFSLRRKAWRGGRRGHRGGNRNRLLDGLWAVRGDGKHQPVAAGAGRLVARPNFRTAGRIPDFEGTDVSYLTAVLPDDDG